LADEDLQEEEEEEERTRRGGERRRRGNVGRDTREKKERRATGQGG